jgi:hypothetical protein
MSGYAPSISDDGSKIAFYGGMDHDDSEIFVVNLDAGARASPEPRPKIEPFSTTLGIASVGIVAVVGIGSIVYFKKRKTLSRNVLAGSLK